MEVKKKKSLRKIILIFAILLCAGVGALLLYTGLARRGKETTGENVSRLYWNVDRKEFTGSESGLSTRKKNADGFYTICFAVDGKQEEFNVQEYKLVNKIDSQDLMGLKFDENGNVVDVLDVKDITAGEISKSFTVTSVESDMIVVNSSIKGDGMSVELPISDVTRIYNVVGEEPVGHEDEVQVMDKLRAFTNEDGDITHIFIVYRDGAVAGESIIKYCEHCKEEVAWNFWTDETALPTSVSGHWRLLQDVKLETQQSIQAEQEIILDLNGKTVTGARNTRVYSLHNEGCSLSILDQSEAGTGTLKALGVVDQGGVVWGRYGVINLYSGTLDASEAETRKTGTALTVETPSICNMYGGTIIGGTAKANFKDDRSAMQGGLGGSVAVEGKGTFIMYGGVIRDGKVVAYSDNSGNKRECKGGNVWVGGDATFTMKGGEILNGKVLSTECNGGNVGVSANATFNMEGGSIKGGKTLNAGGNMVLAGTLNMSGGTIADGECRTGDTIEKSVLNNSSRNHNIACFNGTFNMTGGLISGYVEIYDHSGKECKVKISGTAKIMGEDQNLYLAVGDSIELGKLQKGANICITGVGYVSTKTNASNVNYVHSDYKAPVIYANQKLYIGKQICVCGGEYQNAAGTTVKGHFGSCDGTILEWWPWANDSDAPVESGNWYLLKDVKLKAQKNMSKDVTLRLDLNGHQLYGCEGLRVYSLLKGGVNMTVTDLSAEKNGSIVASGSGLDQGNCIWVVGNSKLTMYAGTLDATKAISRKNGTAICVDTGCEFTMYGGTIKGGTAKRNDMGGYGYAGTIFVNGKFAMWGGKVLSGKSESSGGNIAVVKGGNFVLHDGEVLGGVTEGAKAANGESTAYGGNIWSRGRVDILGGTIAYGNAAGNGGNLALYSTELSGCAQGYISGGVIEHGTAGLNGGNVFVNGYSDCTLSGGVIRLGKARSGGNMFLQGGFNMSGGEVKGGVASVNKNSGNAFINNTKQEKSLTISGGLIEGLVRVHAATKLTLTGTPVISKVGDTGLSLNTGIIVSIGELRSGAKIAITASGVFASDAVDADRKYFTSDAGMDIEMYDKDKLKLKGMYSVMGNNVLSSALYSPEKGKFPTERYQEFYTAYETYMPDVFALQECNWHWHALLDNLNNMYDNEEYKEFFPSDVKPISTLGYKGVANKAKYLGDNATPIYYNTKTLKEVESGWESYEVNIENKEAGWGFTWAVFESLGSGERFAVSSTHIVSSMTNIIGEMDIQEARKAQIEQLVTFMKNIESRYGVPVIMLADYNVAPTESAYEGFELGTKLLSARDVAKVVEGSEYQTSNSIGYAPPFTDADGAHVIDHCMISTTGIAPLKYQTLVEEIADGKYTYTYSDHVPQRFEFRLLEDHEHTYEDKWISETENYISHAKSCDCGMTIREKHTWNVTDGTGDVIATCADCNMSLTAEVARLGCYCANVGNIKNHTCETNKIWMAWTRSDALPIASGNYYLTSNVQLKMQQTINEGAEIYLDLNGKTVTGAENKRIYSTNAGGVSLHITDTSEGAAGTLKARGSNTDKGMIVWVSGAESRLYFYAGTMDASEFTGANGIAVHVSDGGRNFYMYGGTIKGGTATNQGGSVYVTGGSFTMNGGTIQGGKATNQGGNVCLTSSATFTMNGGTIEGGTSTDSNGGNIYAGNDFIMTGGNITGGTAKKGGNVYQNNKTMTMTGGSITGGTATDGGGNVELYGALNLDGGSIKGGKSAGIAKTNMYIDQGYKTSETLVLNGTVDGGIEIRTMSKDGIRVGSKTKITRNNNGFGLRFLAENANKTAGVPTTTPWLSLVDGCTWEQLQDEAIALSQHEGNVGATVIAQGISGTGIANFYRIVSFEDKAYRPTFGANAVTITQWTGTDKVPTATGNYYLTKDVNNGKTETTLQTAGTNVWLDLNGHKIDTSSNIYATKNAVTISIGDSSDSKKGSIVSTEKITGGGGGILLVRASGIVNIYGGLLDASSVTNTDTGNGGGAFYVAGTLNVYGGHIKGGTVAYTGGAVYVPSGGVLTLHGNAVIEGGTAPYGGCIAVIGTLTMNGGTIQNGTATTNGGCLYVKGTFHMNGGTVTGGTATTNGGNIFVTAEGKMNYAGTAVLQNITNSKGGATNWSAANGVFVVAGGTMTNTATE